ncbi:hypothetical protein BDZ89DRAFT_1125523 [Hymenopellis radicata]|nr:hypothetical protein BDZ89DRAFT_1125523 [Hymenopellis radicata]
MSNLSAAPPEFDFWEFVNCARCQLPFFSPSGATIPFWLTECGHIVCNNHLNADQSCAVCASPGIQLVPLQQEMDAPMADWFRSIPYALDSVAYAAKSPVPAGIHGAQIRYYKARHQQQRAYIEKLKQEIIELRRSNQYLSQGVQFQEQQEQQQEQQMEHHDMIQRRDLQEPSTSTNVNGKRPMMEFQRPTTSSSPHSGFIPPIGPNRLTVPPGQQPQNLAANRADELHQQRIHQQAHQRPESRSFQQQYAYIPPSTPHMPPPQVSHAQNRHHINRTNTLQPSSTNSATAMPPPPVPTSKFKPAQPSGNNRDQNRNVRQPPPPQSNGLQRSTANVASTSNHQGSLNRFLPPNERFAPPSSVNKSDGGGRFVPPTPAGAPQRFITRSNPRVPAAQSSSREPARAGTGIPKTASGGGQRMPFIPNGFG